MRRHATHPQPRPLITSRLRRRSLIAIWVAIATIPLAAAGAQAAGSTITAKIGTCQVSGSDSDHTPLTVRLKAHGGAVKSTTVGEFVSGDAWTACFPDAAIAPGDMIVVKRDGAVVRTLPMPGLTVSVDRVTDLVSGRGPAGDDLRLITWDCLGAVGGTCETALDVVVGIKADGTWKRDTSALHDLAGGDRIRLAWQGPAGSTVIWNIDVPHLSVTIGDAEVTGSGRPTKSSTVRLKNAAGQQLGAFATVARLDGTVRGVLRKQGSTVPVSSGDRISSDLAADASFKARLTVKLLGGIMDGVGGRCFAKAPFTVALTRPGYGATHHGMTDADGDYTVTGVALDAFPGGTVTVSCRRATGDLLTRSVVIP